ncbi:SpoIIE family protein phosphatase [Jatrophihabitans sp. YIM 134969]
MEQGQALVPPVLPARLGEVESSLQELAALAAGSVGLTHARIVRTDGVAVTGTTDALGLPHPTGSDPLVVADTTADPSTADLPAVTSGDVGAYVGVPVIGPRGAVRAVLEVHGPHPRVLPPDAIARLQRFAALLATGLDSLEHYDELEGDRQRWELAVSAGGIGSFDWDLVTNRLDWDDRLMELFGYDADDFVPHIDSFTARLHPEDVPPTEAIIAEAIAVSGRYRAEYRVVRPDGTVRWAAARGQVIRDVDGRPVRMLGVAFDVTEAHQARSMVQRTRDRLSLLAAVSSALGDHRNPERAVSRLASVLVPRLADYCIVSLVGEDGKLRDVGSHHPSRDRDLLLGQYAEHRLRSLAPSSWVLRAASTGRITVVPYPSWENLLPALGDPVARAALTELGPAFVICVPLRIRDQVLGVVTLFNDLDTGPFGATDQQVAAEVAARAAVALDAARSFGRQRRIAEALQRSLLTAPAVGRPWEIAVRYVASVDDLQVGGDWYDAFPLPDGSLVVTVGDVMGHDSSAAARMGQLRSLLRGVYVAGSPSPARALELADEAMTRYALPGSATAIVAHLRSKADGTVDVEMSVAGHPPPVLVGGPDGTRTASVVTDPPIGVRAGTRRSVQFSLQCGETLLGYTDGLIERRDEDIDVGIERLRLAAEAAGPDPESLLGSVLATLAGHRADDDVAMLAVRCPPGAAGGA